MKNVLRIDSSVFAAGGVSSQLAEHLEQQLKQQFPAVEVNHKSLDSETAPHLDGAWLQALNTPASERNDEQAAKVAYSNAQIQAVRDADALILTAPMYNFQVPSVLRAWLDHLPRAGETFKYSEQGPVGLIKDKPVYVITTRGGIHKDQPHDTIVTFLKTILGFIGLTQVEFIYAEGLSMGDEARAKGIEEAKQTIDALISAPQAA